MGWGRILRRVGIGMLVVLGLLQLVPYGWRHPNPPVTQDAPWPDADSERIARTSCYDCHSNETDWPAYAYVAPMSWLVRSDVEGGRDELNFSTWSDDPDADDAAEAVADRSMPPTEFTWLHPDARLSRADRDLLVAALTAMEDGGGDDGGSRGRGGG